MHCVLEALPHTYGVATVHDRGVTAGPPKDSCVNPWQLTGARCLSSQLHLLWRRIGSFQVATEGGVYHGNWQLWQTRNNLNTTKTHLPVHTCLARQRWW